MTISSEVTDTDIHVGCRTAPTSTSSFGAPTKIYAESFEGPAHLEGILLEARGIVGDALAGGGT